MLTREWALAVRVAKLATWALTREWALAQETTVLAQLDALGHSQSDV